MNDYLQGLLNEREDGKDYKWLEEYKIGNSKIKHKIKHLVCNHIYEVTPSNFKKGRGCPKCAKKNKIKINYLQNLLNNESKDYQWLEDYKGKSYIKHKIKHLVCGNIYEVTPNRFQQGCRCPICSHKYKTNRVNSDFYLNNILFSKKSNYLNNILIKTNENEDYQWLEDYKGKSYIKHKIKHLVCGHIYEVQPNNFQQGCRCPICSKQKNKIIKKQKKIILENKNEEYEWLDKYENDCHKKIRIKHLVCGNIYKVSPTYFQRGDRCPFCSFKPISKPEKEMVDYIKKIYKGEIKLNDRSILSNQELDIYLPDLNLAFEYNGLYWHSEKFRDRNYHYNKMVECSNKGINLIQFWENEWKNKKEIVKSKIRYLLNKIQKDKIINARECYIKEISKEKTNNFLKKNCIQRKKSKYICCYGMFYKRKLVQVITFNKNLKNEIILSRYTTKRFHNVIGGFSRMLNYAINENNWKEIYSYADLRLSDGNLYESNGWKKIKYVSPDYFFTTGKKIKSKFLFNKENNTSKYYKIWDCGKIKYKYEIKEG